VRTAHPTVNVVKEKLNNTKKSLMCGILLIILEARHRILAIGYN